MAAAVRLLAWSLVLVSALVRASSVSEPFRSEHHARPRAAGASLGHGWGQELAGQAPPRSPSQEALWTRQALPAPSPVALAAPVGVSLVGFSGAGEPDDELWPGSSHAPSAAVGHDSGSPPAPGGSSALRPPARPLLLGADESLRMQEVTPAPGPAGTERPGLAAATFQGHAGRGWHRRSFTPVPGAEAENLLPPSGALRTGGSPGPLAFEGREPPSGLEPRHLQPASPSPARPPAAESSPGPAGRDRAGAARTPSPSPTVSTIALASGLGWWQAAGAGPGGAGREGWPGSWAPGSWAPGSWAPGMGQPSPRAHVPWELLEQAWGKGPASHTQGYSLLQGRGSTLPAQGHAQGLPPHPTGRAGQSQTQAQGVPGASLAPMPGAASQPQEMAGAGAPALLSSGRPQLSPGLAPTPGRPTELAPLAQGGPTLGTRAPAWTEGLSAHQRSTRRALPGAVTQAPHLPGTATPGAPQGPEQPHARPTLHASPGAPPPSGSPAPTPPRPGAAAEEEIGPPQRVRGAVDPRTPVNVTSTATSAPVLTAPGTRHSDAAGTQPPGHSSTTAPAPTPPSPPATPRRGLIRVTTQRALQRPPLPEPGPSRPATAPASSPPCPPAPGACSPLPLNQTLLRWADLRRTLGSAWQLHVYGASALFLLLSLGATASLIGSPVLGLPRLPYTMGANALLLAVGLLRATFLLADPYGARARLPAQAMLLLYHAPVPLLLSAFALLLLLLLQEARLQLLPPRLQSLPLLAALASLQSAVLLGADLLPPPLSPGVPVGLHLLSCACGSALMLASLAAYRRLRHRWAAGADEAQRASLSCEDARELPGQGRVFQGLCAGARVLLGCGALGLLCCGQQAYGVLWLRGVLGPPGQFSWLWWGVQFWARSCELLLAFALCFVASHACCQRCGAADHTCWAKILRYFCSYRKAEAPEYPSTCYAWAPGAQERAAGRDLSRTLIRNPPERVHLRALKDSHEGRATAAVSAGGSTPSLGRPGVSPKCHSVAHMGRSYTSVCFERASVLSLGELEFRPPSPINLSRSIDNALFKEHLVRDSLFQRASLQCPGRLARQDSCASLHERTALTPMAEPLLPAQAWPRRSSDPDYLYGLARCSSLSDLPSQSASLPQSKGMPSEPPTEGAVSGSSLDSFSRGSLKISWNPWRHGLASLESLPLEETPSRAQLLPQEAPRPGTTGEAGDVDPEARKSFLALSRQVDSRSLSSDTIEL
ncbi:proline-rich transmembrane protein 3 isoform X2 [Emydura macquarii macquarii]|uniref:proline-rich transmembrane protein 3 isoform X2 n=1 Tax=Emydura macquarii macquarii TaxID=1129001 RepID=UPI00352A1A49